MLPRPSGVAAVVLTAVALAAVGLAQTDSIHRHSFSGRDPVLVRGDANVRADVTQHDVSTQAIKSQPTSEHLQLTLDAGAGDSAFVHYGYDTPPAPVSPALSASVWVKATKPGVQLRARVVLPNERDPARPDTPLTLLIVGKTCERTRSWEKLTIENVPELLGKHLIAVRAKVGREVNTDGAFIDRLVLNVYTGPGPVDIWVDDLEIGPVRRAQPPPGPAPGAPGTATALPKPTLIPNAKVRQVEQRGGQLLVDGKEHFFRAIRHTGAPLHVLKAAGFDSLWLPPDAAQALVDDADREGWLIIPSAPPIDESRVSTAPAEALLDAFRRKFGGSNVLFWDLGGGLTDDKERTVSWTASEVRKADRRRPLGGDLWDGFQAYSQRLDVVGAHRWPLFTSLELTSYREWLAQRRELAGNRPVFWTWVQNHLPEGSPVAAENAGPHPEQVRQLAFLAVAAGCRGLGFWSDAALGDAEKGRDRLHGMALLNTELDLLDRVLTAAGIAGRRTGWLPTSHPYVQAALIPGQKGLLVLPIWVGPGDQYVPGTGAVTGLSLTIPGVADGQEPWLITPAGVECLRHRMKKTTTGTQLTIDEFDTVAPIVFTDDLTPRGLVVEWQDHARRYGRSSARWALDLARATYEKVKAVHVELAQMGVTVTGGDGLLEQTHRYYADAETHYANEVYDGAYKNATRALRPLRVLMRAHWQLAVGTLDLPSASPFGISYFTLPKHWEFARQVQAGAVGANVLPNGAFEFAGDLPAGGVPIGRLPGWSVRAGSIQSDKVAVAAGVVPVGKYADEKKERRLPPPGTGLFAPSRPVPPPDEPFAPTPELGKGVLRLEVRATPRLTDKGEVSPYQLPLERTFLAVDGPPVRLPPGTPVRVSGWIKVPDPLDKDGKPNGAPGITATADGALLYDDAGGEPLGVRVMSTGNRWRRFQLYRRVPASGQIGITAALTGSGVALFDDLRIEPIGAGVPPPPTVQPAAYRPR